MAGSMSSRFIRKVWQRIFGMGRENGVWVVSESVPRTQMDRYQPYQILTKIYGSVSSITSYLKSCRRSHPSDEADKEYHN